ncbi:hypothetical protein ACTXT7_003525 [Hymenolepis weldensis]
MDDQPQHSVLNRLWKAVYAHDLTKNQNDSSIYPLKHVLLYYETYLYARKKASDDLRLLSRSPNKRSMTHDLHLGIPRQHSAHAKLR